MVLVAIWLAWFVFILALGRWIGEHSCYKSLEEIARRKEERK